MAKQNRIGKEGEEEACKYLTEKNYTVLDINWRWRHYELDIVASTGSELVIIEVKTRSGSYLLPPKEAVDRGKVKRLVAAADAYVQRFEIDKPVRFDIITLVKRETSYEIEHLEDAFYAPLTWKK